MTAGSLDTPYRGGFVGTRAPLRADRLFRGHRRLRHRLLRQLSEVHGAGALGHDPRGRGRPGGRASRDAAAPMRWSRSTSDIDARRGSATTCSSSAPSSRSAPSSVLIHQRVMRGEEQLTDARVTAAFLDGEGRPRRQPKRMGRKVQGNHRAGSMTCSFADRFSLLGLACVAAPRLQPGSRRRR